MYLVKTGAVVGQSEEDARSLSLLNKLIGAQILVQSTEAALSGLEQHPDAKIISSSTTSEELSPDGSVSKHAFSHLPKFLTPHFFFNLISFLNRVKEMLIKPVSRPL